ncbi:MAG: AAA family ATPase [Pacificimonas sp.]|jgi:chloramphenicol 3-O phosphotransferase|nr:AAA family ATPase [Pacificimonas sp.]
MILLVNGPSSAGKTSLCRALQRSLAGSWIYLALDMWLSMLETTGTDCMPVNRGTKDEPEIEFVMSPLADEILADMRVTAERLARAGHDLIIDEVIWDPAILADYRRRLDPFDLKIIAATAPIAVLTAREKARGDRHLGASLWQSRNMNLETGHDWHLDTSTGGPIELAAMVADHFGLERRG